MAIVAVGCNKGETPAGPSTDDVVVNSDSDGNQGDNTGDDDENSGDDSGDNSDSDSDSGDDSDSDNDSDDNSDDDSDSDDNSGSDDDSNNDSDDNSGDSDNDSDSGDDSDGSDSDTDANNNNDNDGNNNNNSGNSSPDLKIINYPFDDLAINCAWDVTAVSNPYGIMRFDEQPRWGACSGNGPKGMSTPVIKPMDSRYYRPDEPHTTVAYLDEPADTVSIKTANDRPDRSTRKYYSSLIAYDAQGNQIDIAENVKYYLNNGAWSTRLTVARTSGEKIHSIGISTYQNATFIDHMRFVIAKDAKPDPDMTPPDIFLTVEHDELTPPDHRMVLAVSGIEATDDRAAPVNLDVGVESNEPVSGLGDGDTSPDWEIVQQSDGSVDVYLRAERSGTGNGRVYTVTVRAEDAAGNVSEQEVEVRVPNNQGDDGQDNADNNSGNVDSDSDSQGSNDDGNDQSDNDDTGNSGTDEQGDSGSGADGNSDGNGNSNSNNGNSNGNSGNSSDGNGNAGGNGNGNGNGNANGNNGNGNSQGNGNGNNGDNGNKNNR